MFNFIFMMKKNKWKIIKRILNFSNKIIFSVLQKKFYDSSLLNNLLFMIIKFSVIKFKLGCKILIAYFRWNIITKLLLPKIAITEWNYRIVTKNYQNSSVLHGINIINEPSSKFKRKTKLFFCFAVNFSISSIWRSFCS